MKILESVLKSWNKHARLILSLYLLHTQPCHSQVLINDSPNCLPYNSLFASKRIWYWIHLFSPYGFLSLLSSLVCLILLILEGEIPSWSRMGVKALSI